MTQLQKRLTFYNLFFFLNILTGKYKKWLNKCKNYNISIIKYPQIKKTLQDRTSRIEIVIE